MPLIPSCFSSGLSFKRHFFPHHWSQSDVLKKTGVREVQDGMCLMLTIEWLSHMIRHHASVDTSFIRLTSDRTLLKQIAGQQRHYVTDPLSSGGGSVPKPEMVQLASKHTLFLGSKSTFLPANMADRIADRIDAYGRPCFVQVRIDMPTGAHSIGFAVDMFGTFALFDPNFGLAIIQQPYIGSVQRRDLFDEIIDELIYIYDVTGGHCMRLS